MNYFELYGLPVCFNPDQDEVKRKFYALSKQYHPDFYIGQSPEKQEEALELSTLNNKAYQVLKDDQKRLHYVLQLKEQLSDGENYSLPPVFLMEMMEVNEALMEQEFDSDPEKLAVIAGDVAVIETTLNTTLHQLTELFDAGKGTAETLTEIKDIYYRRKYIQRIKESLSRLQSS